MIYEEEKLKQSEFKKALDELMTEDEQKRVAYYINKYTNGRNKLQDKLEEWEEIHKAYTGVRTDGSNVIAGFLNIVKPYIVNDNVS